MRRLILWGSLAGLGGLIVVGIIMVLVGLVSYERLRGYYSPIFARDGASVFYVQRETSGVTWGLGWESFTAPAHAYALSDRFSLHRLDLASGAVEEIRRWPDSPAVQQHLRAYRGKIFQVGKARLRIADNGELEYRVGIGITRKPRSERHFVSRVWDNSKNIMVERDRWRSGDTTGYGFAEDSVHGSRELIAVPGREIFPAAILLADHAAGTVKVLLKSGDFDGLYPDGVPESMIDERSNYAQITRIRTFRRTQSELVARFRAQGLSEGEALLRTSKELQRLGFLPKSPTITARPVGAAGDGVPLFEIADLEMASGVFPDIEKAIASPGDEVDKTMGKYVIHRDYTTSAALNALLAERAERFRVRYRGQVYELVIDWP